MIQPSIFLTKFNRTDVFSLHCHGYLTNDILNRCSYSVPIEDLDIECAAFVSTTDSVTMSPANDKSGLNRPPLGILSEDNGALDYPDHSVECHPCFSDRAVRLMRPSDLGRPRLSRRASWVMRMAHKKWQIHCAAQDPGFTAPP